MNSSPTSSSEVKKGSLLTVFLVVLIDLLGFGLILPLLPFYAQEFAAGPVVIGLLYSVYSFSQLIFSPIWGSYSDRVGRRPIMLLSTFGAALAYLLFGFAESLAVLFISRVLAGVMGGNISTAQAYISDITTPENRSRGMGLIGAAFGLGFVIGPALATGIISDTFHEIIATYISTDLGAWVTANKYGLPGFFAASLSLLSFALVWMKLPETVDKNQSSVSQPGRRPRVSVFNPEFWKVLQRSGGGKNLILPLLFSSFLLAFGESTLYSAFPLFCESLLNMTAGEVGIQFFYIGLIAVVIQGGLIRPLTKTFGEKRLFLAGNIFMVLGMGLIPFATSIPMLSLFLGIMAVGKSLNTPTLFSLISQEASNNQYGTILGTSQGLSGLGRMIGPTWGGLLFGVLYFTPFVGTAIILLLTIVIGFYLLRKS